MATLKTDYRDDVLATSMNGVRRYTMVYNDDGTVSLTDASTYTSVGSNFGGAVVNATNAQVNTNTNALNGNQFTWDAQGHPYISNGTYTKKLGSSEGTATTAQVLAGATFNSANTSDSEEYSTGTMVNNGAVSKTITPTASDQSYTVPQGYHNGSGKVTVKGVAVSTPTSAQILSGTSVSVTSNGSTLSSVTGAMPNYNGQNLTLYSATAGSENDNSFTSFKMPLQPGYVDTTTEIKILNDVLRSTNPCLRQVGTLVWSNSSNIGETAISLDLTSYAYIGIEYDGRSGTCLCILPLGAQCWYGYDYTDIDGYRYTRQVSCSYTYVSFSNVYQWNNGTVNIGISGSQCRPNKIWGYKASIN